MKLNRVNFTNIYNKYKALGKANVRLTQSTLFLTKAIDPAKTVYTFDVLETQTGTLANDEIRLNINDEFIVTELGLYLQATIAGEGVLNQSKVLLTNTLPNVNIASSNVLQDFYNGQLKMAVNNIVYVEKWDSKKHEITPRTETGSTNAGVQSAKWNSNNFSQDAMYELAPMITLSGAKKNEISLSLPGAIGVGLFNYTDDAGILYNIEVNRVALMLRGLNAQNASNFQSGS